MTVWIVLGAIAAALVLLSLVRIGGTVEYSRSGTLVHLRFGPLRIRVYPPKPKKKAERRGPRRKSGERRAGSQRKSSRSPSRAESSLR